MNSYFAWLAAWVGGQRVGSRDHAGGYHLAVAAFVRFEPIAAGDQDRGAFRRLDA